ncbi:hypothetical protein [Changchengzhania lutea]|uniref:hypothetical protein n=1 Tax=Changchengzhania lutea TaxID=2049305 RepID=UPI00115D5CDF|nr:hypothetical protein [Changchengzhania lutea]
MSLNLRYYFFWLIDALKGSNIKKHLNEIELIQNNFTTDRSKALRKSYLEKLLKHATLTTAFYNDYKSSAIKGFPIIDKNVIRENKVKFQSKSYIKKQKKYVSSSGSTGATISLYHNKNKIDRNKADNIYFYKLTGYQVGQKLFYMRLWLISISTISKWLKNIEPVDILLFNDRKYISKIIGKLRSKKAKSILGYASALEKMCVFLDQNNYSPFTNTNIKSAIATSEGLNNYTKEKMKYYFNTTVFLDIPIVKMAF